MSSLSPGPSTGKRPRRARTTRKSAPPSPSPQPKPDPQMPPSDPSMCPIEDTVPPEVLRLILERVSPSETLFATPLTCRRWCETQRLADPERTQLCLSGPTIYHEYIGRIYSHNYLEEYSYFTTTTHLPSTTYTNYYNQLFSGTLDNDGLLKILDPYANDIVKISSRSPPERFYTILPQKWPNIQHLSIRDLSLRKHDTMHQLLDAYRHTLRSLSFCVNKQSDDVRKAPKNDPIWRANFAAIESLESLRSLFLAFPERLDHLKSYLQPSLSEHLPQTLPRLESLFLYNHSGPLAPILSLLSEATLTRLSLFNVQLDNANNLIRLVKEKPALAQNLTHLTLLGCSIAPPFIPIAYWEPYWPETTRLPLTVLQQVCRNFVNLKYLSVDLDKKVTIVSILKELSRLEHLEHLYLRFDYGPKLELSQAQLSSLSPLASVLTLRLRISLNEMEHFERLLSLFPNLEQLYLHRSSISCSCQAEQCVEGALLKKHTRGCVAFYDFVKVLNEKTKCPKIVLEPFQEDVVKRKYQRRGVPKVVSPPNWANK